MPGSSHEAGRGLGRQVAAGGADRAPLGGRALRLVVLVVLLWGVAATVAACGSSKPSSSTTEERSTTSQTQSTSAQQSASGGKPAYCAQADSLRESIVALSHINLATEGIAGIEAAARKVIADGEALAKAVKSELRTQASALEAAGAALSKSLQEAQHAETRAAAVARMPAEIAEFGAAAHAIIESGKCE